MLTAANINQLPVPPGLPRSLPFWPGRPALPVPSLQVSGVGADDEDENVALEDLEDDEDELDEDELDEDELDEDDELIEDDDEVTGT